MSPSLAKSASDKGQIGKLVCRATGAPDISFMWSRLGRVIQRKIKQKETEDETEESEEAEEPTEEEKKYEVKTQMIDR